MRRLAVRIAASHIAVMAKLGIIALLALLGVAIWYAYGMWTAVDTEPLPATLYLAMALGALFSLLVGGGLMALLFYSSRHGYDEHASGGPAVKPKTSEGAPDR
jgi:hypothetical protein